MPKKEKVERPSKAHATHTMGKWTSGIGGPNGDRFGSFRTCSACEGQECVSVAGHHYDVNDYIDLREPCRESEQGRELLRRDRVRRGFSDATDDEVRSEYERRFP